MLNILKPHRNSFPKFFKLKYFLILFSISISMAQQTETQSYDVIEKHDNIEIRYYPPAAKVMSKGKINGNSNFMGYI